MPPPPPKQIILVNYSTGLELDALYDPIWISGDAQGLADRKQSREVGIFNGYAYV